MNWRSKVLLVGGAIFILIAIISGIYNRNVCNPEWKTAEENLEYLRQTNTIKEIQIYKESEYPNVNLTGDTIKITNAHDIQMIHRMINDRYSGTWNRPVALWSTKMKLIMDNQRVFEFRVSKISNDKSKNMTHLYFGSKHCSIGPSPSCSETLGYFLETLTSYEGVNH